MKRLMICLAMCALSCVGALSGGKLGGFDDRRTLGKKTWDTYCADCHVVGVDDAHRRVPGVPVPAPDLFSDTWKRETSRRSYLTDISRPQSSREEREEVDAAFMYTLFSSVLWYGLDRTPDGRRPTYDSKRRTTLDGLPIFIPTEKTVVSMPSFLGRLADEKIDAIRNWITCVHYPKVAHYCERMR